MTEPENNEKIFGVRERWKKIRAWDGVLHLFSLAILVLISLILYPGASNVTGISNLQSTAETVRATEMRQQMIEALDKIVRYQNYYKEIQGHFTRDLTRLGLPERLSTGTFEDVRRYYEISVLETGPSHMLLIAVGNQRGKDRSLVQMDRVTMDERHRLNANFIVPPPTRAYLYEEADRILRLRLSGSVRLDSVYASYWEMEKAGDGIVDWVAVGQRAPVQGEHRGLASPDMNALKENDEHTLFDSVSGQLRARALSEADRFPASVEKPSNEPTRFREEDAREILLEAYQAQHIFKNERGHYATRWEDLDGVVGFQFSEKKQKISNLRFRPIAVVEGGYQITIEGTSGDLVGEQFQIDQNGNVRQVRYTDALIQQLQQSTEFLENTFKFQISEVKGKGFLDSEKAQPVKSTKQRESGRSE